MKDNKKEKPLGFCMLCGKNLKPGQECDCQADETETASATITISDKNQKFCVLCGKPIIDNKICDCVKNFDNAQDIHRMKICLYCGKTIPADEICSCEDMHSSRLKSSFPHQTDTVGTGKLKSTMKSSSPHGITEKTKQKEVAQKYFSAGGNL